ncbi:synaptotagmin-16-like, partial [Arapaima gigas]
SSVTVTPEAIIFLSAVGVFVVLLAVLFLFINKKLCFSNVGGLPCLELYGKGRRSRGKGGATLGLVDSYGEDDDCTTSSDSGDEVLKQFEMSMSCSQSFHMAKAEKDVMADIQGRHKHTRLLSDQGGSDMESSDTEARGHRSGSAPLDGQSCWDNDQEVLGKRDPAEGLELEVRQTSAGNKRRFYRQEMETAIDNLGYDHNEASDRTPTWSTENCDRLRLQCRPPSTHLSISTCGDLVTCLEYKPRAHRLLVTVVEVRGIPPEEQEDIEAWQMRLVLLPSRRRRHKTNMQQGPTPCFCETFRFSRLDPVELSHSALRFRLYAVSPTARESLAGQGLLHLGGLSLEGKMESIVVLESRSNRELKQSASGSTGTLSTQSLSHGTRPELLLGLAYNAITGRLSVELIKGNHFCSPGINRPPDTYGKLTLLDSVGQEISRCKSSMRHGQPHPVYKETFVFQVALFQLSDVTLLVSIYNRRSMKRKELLGWVSLGQSSSGQEERLHWQDMRESKGQQVCRWYVLQES